MLKLILKPSIELHKELTNFLQSTITDFFNAYSYICYILVTFSKQNDFIIQFQKLPDDISIFDLTNKIKTLYNGLNLPANFPIFQFAKEIKTLYNRLQLPLKNQEKYNLQFYNALQAHNSKQIQELIYNIKKDFNLILSKKSITKYFINEYIFISREHKDIKELYNDKIIINALEKLKKENKQYQNISIEDGISQAFSYFKELEQKLLPTVNNKIDDRNNQYLRSYKIAHGDFCYIISNPINNALFYCNNKFAKSTPAKKDNIIFNQINIKHQANHPIIIYANNPFEIKPLYIQLWTLLLQEINCTVRPIQGKIIKAYKNNEILEENYRKIKLSINNFIALKAPANFGNYRSKKIPFIQNFCDFMAKISIEAEYKNQYKWKKRAPYKLFDSIRINDNYEIEAVLTDEYIKVNALTSSSQMLFSISAFSQFDFLHYENNFNLYILFLIHNRINGNKKEKRVLTISKIINWLGFDINEERKKEKLFLLPKKIYNNLNELCNKLGLSILFDNKNLEALKNYKWTAKRIKKDTLKEFEEKKITFSFDDKMEKILRNNPPKEVKEYREEAKELKKQK